MAENDTQTPPATNENTPAPAAKVTYWRSRTSGLKIILGPPQNGETQPPYLQFEPFQERWDGDLIKVGYLQTDNAFAIERLEADSDCEKITKSEYEEKTDLSNEKVKRLPL